MNGAAHRGFKRVLVVDDEASVVQPIESMLRMYNYRPITATHWTDALVALEDENPDLLLLDLAMPIVEGPSLMEFIRERGYTVPIVVISAYVTDQIAEGLSRFGVEAFIQKPFDIFDLMKKVEHIIGPAHPTGQVTPEDVPGLEEVLLRPEQAQEASVDGHLRAVSDEPVPPPPATPAPPAIPQPPPMDPATLPAGTQLEAAADSGETPPPRPDPLLPEEAVDADSRAVPPPPAISLPPPSEPTLLHAGARGEVEQPGIEGPPSAPPGASRSPVSNSSARTAPPSVPEISLPKVLDTAGSPNRRRRLHRRRHVPRRTRRRRLVLLGVVALTCLFLGEGLDLMLRYIGRAGLQAIQPQAEEVVDTHPSK